MSSALHWAPTLDRSASWTYLAHTPIRFHFTALSIYAVASSPHLPPSVCISRCCYLLLGNDFECDSVAAVITSIKIWFSHVKQEARHKFKSQTRCESPDSRDSRVGNFLSMCNILRQAVQLQLDWGSRWVIAATQSLVININWAWKSSERMRTRSPKIAHNKDELIKRSNDQTLSTIVRSIVRSIGRWKDRWSNLFCEFCSFFLAAAAAFGTPLKSEIGSGISSSCLRSDREL